jgi:hypothetical protein
VRTESQAVHHVNMADVDRVEDRQSMVELLAVIGGVHIVVYVWHSGFRLKWKGMQMICSGMLTRCCAKGGRRRDLRARQTSQQRQPLQQSRAIFDAAADST